ncbi:MAG: AMP-binding protein [Gemmatimonadota bacterium]|nr:AMP-binding protein [Gemmatimonadota bacterium]
MITWDDPRTDVLLNPRLPGADAARVRQLIAAVPALEAHVWLTTSGATGRLKPVALAKQSLLLSAEAVNRHLESNTRDVWLNVLPTFHVGGLGIYARAHLSGARVVTLESWEVKTFVRALAEEWVTLTSLVPAQVYDLVQDSQQAPPSLRAVVVGGGALAEDLWRRARALGWPVLPSYGATECASQIATADLASLRATPPPALRLLPHVSARTDADGHLEIRSDALFTGYASDAGLDDPKHDGWWDTGDLGAIHGETLVVHGRADDVVKIGGEVVNLAALEMRLAEVLAATAPATDAVLIALPDPRLGQVIALAVVTPDPATAEHIQDAFNAAVLPFERARIMRRVTKIPRTALGKVARRQLEEMLQAVSPDRP